MSTGWILYGIIGCVLGAYGLYLKYKIEKDENTNKNK